MKQTTRLVTSLSLALLSGCGDEVCLPVPNCDSTLTIYVRDANDAPVDAFRGTLEVGGAILDLECPGSTQTNITCSAGVIELLATPTEVWAELTSSDGYLQGSLNVRPTYFETDKEWSCRAACVGGYTRLVLR